jgi:hypothetical protein
MPHESPEETVRDSAQRILMDGPMSLGELVHRLKRAGVLTHLDGLDDEALAEEIDEVLLQTDDVWMSEEGVLALTGMMLDGVVFSHRLTDSELERGVVDATPDLGAVDFELLEGLETSDGEKISCLYPFDGEEDLDANGSFVGPSGWLGSFEADEIVCFRRVGKTLVIQKASELGGGELEWQALRRAFEARHIEGVGVEPDELVLDALCHDPSLFRAPVVPVGELLERAGLERRGAWFGLKGEEWEPPGVRYMERDRAERRDTWGFDSCCEEAFEEVRDAWGDLVLHDSLPPSTGLRSVARALAHGSVAPAFAEYVLRRHDHGSEALALFAAELSRLPGKLAAPGLYLRALEAERDGRVKLAESDLQGSVRADPDFGPALEELAWYEADRGNAAKAISLLRRAGVGENDPALEYLLKQLDTTPRIHAGRNDPCPCGSGRKFKACCLTNKTLPIEARAGWLHQKIVMFALRPPRRDLLERLAEITSDRAQPSALEQLFPILVDVAAMEESLEEFLHVRGDILPRDERELARSWIGSRLVLWEVIELDAGSTVTLRDTRTGDRLVVAERSASQTLRLGEYMLARVVAAGSQNQIVGLPLTLELRHRQSLIELLDSGPDAEELAAWLGAAFAPPHMTNREGEDVVLCRAILRPTSTSWSDLSSALDSFYGKADDGQWTETTTIDGEDVVRCFLRRDEDNLVVETNSMERWHRVITTLRDSIADDLEVIEEEMLSVQEALDRHRESVGSFDIADPQAVPSDLAQAAERFIRRKEDAWLDESVPALGGLTPRQAASDPTRREDLVSLLQELERHDESGVVTFDLARLKERLGL